MLTWILLCMGRFFLQHAWYFLRYSRIGSNKPMLTSFCRICWLSNSKSAANAKSSYQSLHEKSLSSLRVVCPLDIFESQSDAKSIEISPIYHLWLFSFWCCFSTKTTLKTFPLLLMNLGSLNSAFLQVPITPFSEFIASSSLLHYLSIS